MKMWKVHQILKPFVIFLNSSYGECSGSSIFTVPVQHTISLGTRLFTSNKTYLLSTDLNSNLQELLSMVTWENSKIIIFDVTATN